MFAFILLAPTVLAEPKRTGFCSRRVCGLAWEGRPVGR